MTATLANQPPIAVATSSATTAETDEEIIFDGRESTDDSRIIEWYWDFGDGHYVLASTTRYSYIAAGNYEVYLRVADDLGLSATSSPLNISITSSTATTTATTTSYANPDVLVINEIYPAPSTGENEWVEIYNPATSSVDLSGLLLLNIDGGKFVTTTLSGLIEAGGYAVIDDITGNLNNSGDTIILRSTTTLISQTVYGDFSNKQGEAWARGSDGNFSETITPTKGAINVITPKPTSNSGGGGGSYATQSTPIPAVTATTTATSTIAVDYPGLIVINEIYPNPVGADTDGEFIELLNLSTSTIDLTKFVIADASRNKYSIRASTTAVSGNLIQAGGFFVIHRDISDIALNNTGVETVKLYSPDFKMIDQVEYLGENKEGVSYSRTEAGKWRWVKTPTPGEANAEDELYPDDENPALLGDLSEEIKLVGVAKPATSKKPIQNTTLAQLDNFSPDDQVRVRGAVSVLPGVLGSQFFYLAGSGAQIYCSKKDFPDLQIGDYIEVSGTLSDFGSVGRRIKISDRSQIKFIEKQAPPAPHQISAADVGEDYDSWLVTVSGEVLEIKSRNIYLDDGSDEVKIYINNRIDPKDIGAKPGDKMTVTGIVNKSSGGYRLMPRDLKDIAIEKGAVKGDYAVSDSAPGGTVNYYLVAMIIFLLFLVALLFFRLPSRHP